MPRTHSLPASVPDEIAQIDLDRAFAVLDWEMESVLRGRHPRSRLMADEQVVEVVRDGGVVGWEKGWTVLQADAVVERCSVRTLSAFPGRLWLLANGVPVYEIRSEELHQAMLGWAGLIDRASEAARRALDRKRD